MKKEELAKIAYELFLNIDEADQFPTNYKELFSHLDRKFLVLLIRNMQESVVNNINYGREDVLSYSKDKLMMVLDKAEKIISSE